MIAGEQFLQGASEAGRVHTPVVAGSTPAPAPIPGAATAPGLLVDTGQRPGGRDSARPTGPKRKRKKVVEANPAALERARLHSRAVAIHLALTKHLWECHREPVSGSRNCLEAKHEEIHAKLGTQAENFEHVVPLAVYVTPATGNVYLQGNTLPGMTHWDRKTPLKVEMLRSVEAKPLVGLETILGYGSSYTPAQLRALASTFLRIADDADAHPMGPRSFYRSTRGYEVL